MEPLTFVVQVTVVSQPSGGATWMGVRQAPSLANPVPARTPSPHIEAVASGTTTWTPSSRWNTTKGYGCAPRKTTSEHNRRSVPRQAQP